MATETETTVSAPKQIQLTHREPGHAHEQLAGICSSNVTVEDIKQRFYDEYFGGRDAWVSDGQWGCIVHTD